MHYLRAKSWSLGKSRDLNIYELTRSPRDSFVGLTPGILVCLGLFRWLGGVFGKDSTGGKKPGHMVRILRLVIDFLLRAAVGLLNCCRNIDRILTASTASKHGMLSYKEHGLLLCEVHVLRQNGQRVLPGEIGREFLEEINDLVDIRTGVERQLKVVERIRWAYWKWLQ